MSSDTTRGPRKSPTAVSSESLRAEPFLEHADCGGTAGATDGSGQRNFLGANGDAVLGIAAFLDAALGHEGIKALAGVVFAGRIEIEEDHLADGVRPDEAAVVRFVFAPLEGFFGFAIHPFELDFEILRAGVEAAAAAHALAEWIHGLLGFLRDAGAGALIVVAVGRNPGFDLR